MDRKKSTNFIFCFTALIVITAVVFCYPFFICYNAYAVTNSPIYSSWYVAENEPYGLNVKSLWKDIKNKTTYDVTYQKSDVVVAIIDSGLDVNHSYFDGALWTNDKESANGIDDDGNGVIDDIHGANFTTSRYNGDYKDCMTGGTASQYWHGTHVAGIVRSIAPNVKIMPIRAGVKSRSSGAVVCSFDNKSVVEAILYAANNGADIINLSFGTTDKNYVTEKVRISADNSQYSIQDAINFAVENCGAMVVGAMGNDGKSVNFYPACCDNVVSVMASNEQGKRWISSNYLLQADIAAPGYNILSTIGSNVSTEGAPTGYGVKNGTSMAAPYVSGVAALLMSITGVNNGRDIVGYITDKNALSSFDYANTLGKSNVLLDYKACQKILDNVIDGEDIPKPNDIYSQKITCYDNEKLTIKLKYGYVGEAEWYNNGELKNVGYSYTFKPTVNTLIEVRVNGILVEAYEVTVKSYENLILTISLSVVGGVVLIGGVSAICVYFYIKKKRSI